MPLAALGVQADSLVKIADDFWAWRSKHAPFTGDDVNRLERPGGVRDWSRTSIDQRRKDLAQFGEAVRIRAVAVVAGSQQIFDAF